MRILVTGSSGQVGSYVMDLGREQGHDMRGMDIRPNPKWTEVVGDIRDAKACATAMQDIDAVIHCAAHISVQHSIEDPVFDASTNVLGTLNLLEAARKAKVQRFVNVSSAAVYGNPVRLPIDEEHPLQPLSPYGASKVAAETYTAMYGRLHGLSTMCARPFNIYSPRQDPSNPYSGVLSKFATAVRAGTRPIVFGDGKQTRDFIHASDAAASLLTLALVTAGPTHVNVATGQAVRILELAEKFIQLQNSKARPEFKPSRAGDIQHSVADVSLAGSLPRPSVNLNAGIQELLA